jgi:hypothetical protein
MLPGAPKNRFSKPLSGLLVGFAAVAAIKAVFPGGGRQNHAPIFPVAKGAMKLDAQMRNN